MYVCTYVSMYVCMYVCVCVYWTDVAYVVAVLSFASVSLLAVEVQMSGNLVSPQTQNPRPDSAVWCLMTQIRILDTRYQGLHLHEPLWAKRMVGLNEDPNVRIMEG